MSAEGNYPRWLVMITIYDRHDNVDVYAATADVDCQNRRAAAQDVIRALPGRSGDPLIQRMIGWADEGGKYLDAPSARVQTTIVELRDGRPVYPMASQLGVARGQLFVLRTELDALERAVHRCDSREELLSAIHHARQVICEEE